MAPNLNKEDTDIEEHIREQGQEKTEWINTVLKKGTIADRLAARTLLIHESKDWASLNALIDMVDPKKCRRQCMMAMETVKELFLESLNINNHNSNIKTEEDRQKVRFYFAKFVDKLNLVAFDDLEETRRKAIWILSELLNKHTDNRDYILEKLVEKLGDRVKKLAHTAGHLIEKSVNSQKADLRTKVIKCVERFLRRESQPPNARFYAVSLLTRIRLVKGDYQMGNELIQAYLSIYTSLSREKRLDSKLMNAILVGIHRTFPYTKLNNDVFEQHLQSLYTLVHKVNFRMGFVAMVLIKNIVTRRAELMKMPIEDRFYNLIYGQLLSPENQQSSRQEAFSGLLLEVVNNDTVLERKEAFMKRMLQVALSSRPEFSQIMLSTITKLKGLNVSLGALGREDSKDDSESSSDDDENNKDDDEDDDNNHNDNDGDKGQQQQQPIKSSWVHKTKRVVARYDPLARNPRSGASGRMFELYLLRQYFQPNIAKLANSIIC